MGTGQGRQDDDGTPREESPAPTRGKKEPNPWSLAGVGLEFGGVVVVLTLTGHWLDARWNTGPWLMLTGLGVGLIGGTYNLWRQGRRFFDR